MFDVVVIGAGICGAMTARLLTEYGQKVCILERCPDVAMGTTKANSSIVHAGFDAEPGSLKARLNVRGSVMMEEIARQLGVKYRRIGALVVALGEEDKKTLSDLLEKGGINGVSGLEILERDELIKLEPGIADEVLCALHAPTSALVCPYELCIAAVGSAMDNGAELKLSFEVDKIERTDKGYIVGAGDKSVSARCVINCAGVYADEIARLVGDESFSIRPRRGEYLILDKECGNTVSHTVFRCPDEMGKGVLVTPTVDGNLFLGPTATDIDDKEDTSTTPEGFASIRARAVSQVKGIDFSKIIASFAGLRATGNTGDFIINMPLEGFVNVAAIESPGLSSAPAIAEYVRDMLEESGVEMRKDPNFKAERKSLHRFSTLSIEEKNAIIADRPEYGHIVCRCEGVSEGEILEAIRSNPRPSDVDGIKRRTRTGMGRCQGGFCTPYVIGLLARETGVDYGEISKFGGESLINIGRTKSDL
ncbi:MAG TPA: NAD(P)/FAD-dependent oxidoreductase [Bacillota bacterium]|nr:NAD(P)/FAD-dependent oxidoreductase [Bacillota bacterium]